MKYLILMAFSMFSLFGFADKNGVSDKTLVSYTYNRHATMAQPIDDIEVGLTEKGDYCAIKIYVHETGLGEYQTYLVSTSLMTKINEIINSHKIYEYESSYRPQYEILDGESWSYSASYADKYYLQSRGENAYPKDNGLYLINSLIKESIKTGKLIKKSDWPNKD